MFEVRPVLALAAILTALMFAGPAAAGQYDDGWAAYRGATMRPP